MDKQVINENIISAEYSDVMQKSYVDYSMSVIISRAVPDIRDGLKPVQRRILYDMYILGISPDKEYRKSARIVGDTMGKFHPHGDSSIYDALVVMAQDFKREIPLVDGHGNFGSVEGDSAAAMRYTESKLQKITQDAFLSDLDKKIVDYIPNFDETEKEPAVLPVRFSNFLVNGSDGIAVGMTTNTPPHNLSEVIDATVALIKKPSMKTEELLGIIKGPDFPTGGIVANKSELLPIYETGTGKIRIRGKAVIENEKGKKRIVITEIPYTMIGAGIGKFLNDIAGLTEERIITGITDISNQSSKEGVRIVLELKKTADEQNILNILYKKTKFEDTFGVNMLAISNGKPEVVGLKKALQESINFQYEINKRKYTKLLRDAEKKREIQEGLIRAVDVIDLIIEILRGSKNRKIARDCLVNGTVDGIQFKTKKSLQSAQKLHFTGPQADAIMEMPLYRLIGLELDSLQKSHEKTVREINEYTDILSNKQSMTKVIVKDLTQIKKLYGTERKTRISDIKEVASIKAEKETVSVAVLVDKFGYIKAVDANTYSKNKDAIDNEYAYVIPAKTDQRIYVFTGKGKLHIIKADNIPLQKWRDKGVTIDTLCNYKSAEDNIITVVSEEMAEKSKLVFVTKNGLVKKVAGTEFNVTRAVSQATKLEDGDEVFEIAKEEKNQCIVFVTKHGYALKYMTKDISDLKKISVGARGITLKNDEILKVFICDKDSEKQIEINGNQVAVKDIKNGKRAGRGTLFKT